MSVISTKQLKDVDSHNYLLSLGFINVKNAWSQPCYKDPSSRLLAIDENRTFNAGIKDLLDFYWEIGREQGIKEARNLMIERITEIIT